MPAESLSLRVIRAHCAETSFSLELQVVLIMTKIVKKTMSILLQSHLKSAFFFSNLILCFFHVIFSPIISFYVVLFAAYWNLLFLLNSLLLYFAFFQGLRLFTFGWFPWKLYLADRKCPRNPCSTPTEKKSERALFTCSVYSCPKKGCPGMSCVYVSMYVTGIFFSLCIDLHITNINLPWAQRPFSFFKFRFQLKL